MGTGTKTITSEVLTRMLPWALESHRFPVKEVSDGVITVDVSRDGRGQGDLGMFLGFVFRQVTLTDGELQFKNDPDNKVVYLKVVKDA